MQAVALRSQILPTRPASLRACGPRVPFSKIARGLVVPRSADAAAAPLPEEPAAPAPVEEPTAAPSATDAQPPAPTGNWFQRQAQKSAALRNKLASLGPAAVLAYGLFDGVSYTIAFCIAFLGYEAQTGLNPTQNVADIVKLIILMWAGNNVTRPFRLAGAAALAPFMDRLMTKLQERLKLPNRIFSFALITAAVAAVCFSVVGALFLSRWVAGP